MFAVRSVQRGGIFRTEFEALLARNLSPSLPVMRAIGVSEISAWLRGEISRADYESEIGFVKAELKRLDKPHWHEFLAAWNP